MAPWIDKRQDLWYSPVEALDTNKRLIECSDSFSFSYVILRHDYIIYSSFLRVKTISTNQHESFKHILSSLIWKTFQKDTQIKITPNKNILKFGVFMIEPPKSKMYLTI